MKLRTEVLEFALDIEKIVNSILLAFLSIQTPKRKALTNKSGSLSFKNKIDLLFDLDIINDTEHRGLLLLMEFRNQFLHNYDCNSFEIAISILGSDKQKKLLKFDDLNQHKDKESQYKYAFKNLYLENNRMCLEKLDDRKNQIEDLANTHKNYITGQIYFLDKYFDILKNIMTICEDNLISNSTVTQIVDLIHQAIMNDVMSSFDSEEYKKIEKEYRMLHRPEKIKYFFKR